MVTVDLIKSVRHEEGEWGIEKKDRDRENERQKEQLEQIKWQRYDIEKDRDSAGKQIRQLSNQKHKQPQNTNIRQKYCTEL